MAQKCDKILWAALGAFEAEFRNGSKKMTERVPQFRLVEEVDGKCVDGEGSDVGEDGEVV